MGSDALKFPIQLAYVLTFSAILASIGFVIGRRVIEAQLPLCGPLAGISAVLFYRWDELIAFTDRMTADRDRTLDVVT